MVFGDECPGPVECGGGGGGQKLFGIGASLLKVLETLACQKEACVKYS